MSQTIFRSNGPRRLPWWAALADAAALLSLAVAAWVAISGGTILYVLNQRFSMTSSMRVLAAGLMIIVLRHVLVREPSLLAVVYGSTRRVSSVVSDAALWDVMPTFIATRFGVLLVGFFALATFGYAPDAPPFRASESELGNLPMRWDAPWYLSIALRGYQWMSNPTQAVNVAFFPGYPMFVKVAGLSLLTNDRKDIAVWVAVGVSFGAFLAALVYLHHLARALTDVETAQQATVLLSAYPFALFFSAAYSESLFLLCVVAAFFHQTRGQPARAAIWGLLAGLTRPTGVLLAPSLCLIAFVPLWTELRRGDRSGRHALWLRSLPALAASSAPVAGMAAYSVVVGYNTGDPLQWMHLQQVVGWGRSPWALEPLRVALRTLVELGPLGYFQQKSVDAMNLAATVFAVASIWPVTKRLGISYGVFVALSTMVPLLNGGLVGMGRFTSVLFPAFIWLATAVPLSARSSVVFVFAALQSIFAALFYTWRWMV